MCLWIALFYYKRILRTSLRNLKQSLMLGQEPKKTLMICSSRNNRVKLGRYAWFTLYSLSICYDNTKFCQIVSGKASPNDADFILVSR
jgi:hypothetical protein